MKILTIANRKGGAGKSTCAAHMANEASKNNLKTILIDLDPQKTLESWWKTRKNEDIFLIDILDIELLNETLTKLKEKKFDICIIDTPGDMSQNARVGIMYADLVLIPSKPTSPDLTAIGRTISLVEESKKKFVFVITQGITRTKAMYQAFSVLSSFGAVAPAIITNRISYANAMATGKAANETDKTAEEEIKKVWDFISEKLLEIKINKKEKLMV